VILILCALFALDLKLCLCLVYGHITLFVVSCCYWFPLACFLVLPFMFEGLGNWLGKEGT